MINDLLRKSEAYREIASAVAEGKASHAYLVTGDDTVTRKAYMILLAMTFLCKRRIPTCTSTTRTVKCA